MIYFNGPFPPSNQIKMAAPSDYKTTIISATSIKITQHKLTKMALVNHSICSHCNGTMISPTAIAINLTVGIPMPPNHTQPQYQTPDPVTPAKSTPAQLQHPQMDCADLLHTNFVQPSNNAFVLAQENGAAAVWLLLASLFSV